MPLPDWYQSTQGPQISQTIFNIVATFLPVLDLVLMHFGVSIPGLSQTLQALIAMAVFAYFAIRAAIGYVKAKAQLQAQVAALAGQVRAAGQTPNFGAGYTPEQLRY